MVITKGLLAERIYLFAVGLTWVLTCPNAETLYACIGSKGEAWSLLSCFVPFRLYSIFKRFRALVLRQLVRTDKKTAQRSGVRWGLLESTVLIHPADIEIGKKQKYFNVWFSSCFPPHACHVKLIRLDRAWALANQPTLVPSGHQPLHHTGNPRSEETSVRLTLLKMDRVFNLGKYCTRSPRRPAVT